jgi:hypothetical protein
MISERLYKLGEFLEEIDEALESFTASEVRSIGVAFKASSSSFRIHCSFNVNSVLYGHKVRRLCKRWM